MTVGYRSFLVVDDGENVIEPIVEHVGAWVESMDVSVPTDQAGHYRLDDDDVVVVHETYQSSEIYRWLWDRPRVQRPGAISRLCVTAVEETDGPGWFWVEVELLGEERGVWSARSFFAPVPMFVPPILGDALCRDGRTPMTAIPMWASPDHVPDLMDYLADESRRGPVFIASQGAREISEFQAWADDAMSDIIGLGVMFLLSPHVEQEFNEMVGPKHAVANGAVRTYLPGVNLDHYHDQKRHPMLSVSRIGHSSGREVSHLLGAAQRSRLVWLGVPHEAVEIDRMLREREEKARGRADWIAELERVRAAIMMEPTERESIQAVQIAELRLENAHLRADMDVLADRLEHFERCQEGILKALREAQLAAPLALDGDEGDEGR
ncbi:DUF4200 domain-containing protein [Phytoactinopolyspora endophytica]|uniref:DUF4200 domain-containing protein n=1 Tax=Phytoactinopolyspora endophytica TaxID=1642495 RepID=UPI00101D19E9|nr:DUF4200 domain-containing protein [Phytoactinopolyspora endophytica]